MLPLLALIPDMGSPFEWKTRRLTELKFASAPAAVTSLKSVTARFVQDGSSSHDLFQAQTLTPRAYPQPRGHAEERALHALYLESHGTILLPVSVMDPAENAMHKRARIEDKVASAFLKYLNATAGSRTAQSASGTSQEVSSDTEVSLSISTGVKL
jgi:hypothetical protein